MGHGISPRFIKSTVMTQDFSVSGHESLNTAEDLFNRVARIYLEETGKSLSITRISEVIKNIRYYTASSDHSSVIRWFSRKESESEIRNKLKRPGVTDEKIEEKIALAKKALKSINSFLKVAPKYNGGTIYRGWSESISDYENLEKALGTNTKITFNGLTSATSNFEIAEAFSQRYLSFNSYDKAVAGNGKVSVVYVINYKQGLNHSKYATSIRPFSEIEEEDEILYGTEARFKVKNFEPGFEYVKVYLEEV